MKIYPFTLPELKYKYGELSHLISEKAMKLHHQKHHKSYIDKLNDIVKSNDFLKELSVEKMLSKENLDKIDQELNESVRNFGGGHYNHIMFFNLLSPKSTKPGKMLTSLINKDFGSFDEFKKQFTEKSNKHFGSGWCWLVLKNDSLKIQTTKNQDNPINFEVCKPIFGIDLWEHTYYLDYNNRRSDYIDKVFNYINWKEIDNYILESENE